MFTLSVLCVLNSCWVTDMHMNTRNNYRLSTWSSDTDEWGAKYVCVRLCVRVCVQVWWVYSYRQTP